jgi:hypothetical protein
MFPLEAKLRMRHIAGVPSAATDVNMDNVETLLPLLSRAGAQVRLDFPICFAHLLKDADDTEPFLELDLDEAEDQLLRSNGPFPLVSFFAVCMGAVAEYVMAWPF